MFHSRQLTTITPRHLTTHSPNPEFHGISSARMECPKCHFDHPQQTDECLKCGIVFNKYLAFQEALDKVQDVTPEHSAGDIAREKEKAHHEFLCRVFALPGALLFGWIVAWGMPSLAAFLHMWVHETGHAVSAWLCGRPAIPTAWITPTFPRTWWLNPLLGLCALAGCYVAYRKQRWFWVAAAAILLLLVIAGHRQHESEFQALNLFWGEGGAFVLSTMLMMTFYARSTSQLTKNQLRWGLLILGAIAFCHVYRFWAGGFENIANILEDTDERGPSDMRQLTLIYGWTIYTMIHRYQALGQACLLALAAAYTAGIVQVRRLQASLGHDIPAAMPTTHVKNVPLENIASTPAAR